MSNLAFTHAPLGRLNDACRVYQSLQTLAERLAETALGQDRIVHSSNLQGFVQYIAQALNSCLRFITYVRKQPQPLSYQEDLIIGQIVANVMLTATEYAQEVFPLSANFRIENHRIMCWDILCDCDKAHAALAKVAKDKGLTVHLDRVRFRAKQVSYRMIFSWLGRPATHQAQMAEAHRQAMNENLARLALSAISHASPELLEAATELFPVGTALAKGYQTLGETDVSSALTQLFRPIFSP